MKWISLWICLAIALTYLEFYFNNQLEESSLNLILLLQSFRNPLLDLIFELTGHFSAVIFLAAASKTYICGYKEIGLITSYAGFFGASLSGVLKMLIMHPRPFWRFPTIKAISCSPDWGSPSSHTLSSCAAMIVIGNFWLKSQKHTQLITILLILFTFLTALNRIYLGLHFLSQVLLGYAYAAIIGSILIQNSMIKHFYQLGSSRNLVILEHLKLIGFSLFATGMFTIKEVVVVDEWKHNYMKECGKEMQSDEIMLKNFSEAMYVWVIAGFIMGNYLGSKESVRCKSWKAQGLATALFAVAVAVMVGVDKVIFKVRPDWIGVVLACANRYLVGFVINYYFPDIVFKVVGGNDDKKHN